MHLLFSLGLMTSLILAAYALTAGSIVRAIVFAAISFGCALVLRRLSPSTTIDIHHRTEFNHHHHDPVHIHHDHRTHK